MLDDMYQRPLLQLAAHIPLQGRLAAPHGSADMSARLCGSRIVIDVCVQKGLVTAYAHEVAACALGAAAASLLARHVVGARVEALRALHQGVRAMLHEGAPPPAGQWIDFAVLAAALPYKERHASVLLPFDALELALDAACDGEREP